MASDRPDEQAAVCPKCLGRGRITAPTSRYTHNYDCPRCEGSGRVNDV